MKFYIPALALLLTLPSLSQQLPAGTRSVVNEDEEKTALYKRAQAQMDSQNFSEAESTLKELLRRDPKDSGALYELGFAQEAQDKDEAAETSYRAALAASPNQFESTLSLGLLNARQNRPQAHELLAKAVQLTPTDPAQANNLKSRAFRALAQLDERSNPAAARDELLAALKLSPETANDTLMAAELADAAGDPNDAAVQYKKLLAQGSPTPEATISYARFLMRHGQTAQATPLLEQLLLLSPGDDGLKRLLANIYSQNNQPEKAEPLLRGALQTTPDDPILLDDLGSALVMQQKFSEAQEVLTKTISIPVDKWPSPSDLGSAAGHLAFAASENHQPRIVLQALSVRSKLLPNSPSSLFLEATANDSLHQIPQALDLYRRFLTAAAGKFPDQEWQARQRISALTHK